MLALFSRCVFPESQRGVCEGWGHGVAALPSNTAPAEADLDQSHPPRGASGSDRGRVQAYGPAAPWQEPRGSQCCCQPPGELFLFSGVKHKRTPHRDDNSVTAQFWSLWRPKIHANDLHMMADARGFPSFCHSCKQRSDAS